MELLILCSPPAIWFMAKDSFPRVSKLFGIVSLCFAAVLFLNVMNSI